MNSARDSEGMLVNYSVQNGMVLLSRKNESPSNHFGKPRSDGDWFACINFMGTSSFELFLQILGQQRPKSAYNGNGLVTSKLKQGEMIMASTKIATKTKVTERFTLTGEDGEVFQVEQHTRYEIKNVDGVKTEILGSAYLLTADGRGVLHGEIYNSYSIPSLGIKTLKKSPTA